MGRPSRLVLPRQAAVVSEDVSRAKSKLNRRFYSAEFKRQLVEMVRGGRTPEDLAKDYEPAPQTIRNWVTQADRDEGRRTDGLTTDEREELSRLRRENRTLQEEKEILKKAAAWFAQESLSTPPKRSGS
jgi:transposase